MIDIDQMARREVTPMAECEDRDEASAGRPPAPPAGRLPADADSGPRPKIEQPGTKSQPSPRRREEASADRSQAAAGRLSFRVLDPDDDPFLDVWPGDEDPFDPRTLSPEERGGDPEDWFDPEDDADPPAELRPITPRDAWAAGFLRGVPGCPGAGFASGGVLDRLPPGPMLARFLGGALASAGEDAPYWDGPVAPDGAPPDTGRVPSLQRPAVDPAGLTDDDLVGALCAARRMGSLAVAQGIRLTPALA